jgi:hypothetical protein
VSRGGRKRGVHLSCKLGLRGRRELPQWGPGLRREAIAVSSFAKKMSSAGAVKYELSEKRKGSSQLMALLL